MKRLAVVLGLLALLAFFAFPSFGWRPGWGDAYYRGPGYYGHYSQSYYAPRRGWGYGCGPGSCWNY